MTTAVGVRKLGSLGEWPEPQHMGDLGAVSKYFSSGIFWFLCKHCHFSVAMQGVPSCHSLAPADLYRFCLVQPQVQSGSWELWVPTVALLGQWLCILTMRASSLPQHSLRAAEPMYSTQARWGTSRGLHKCSQRLGGSGIQDLESLLRSHLLKALNLGSIDLQALVDESEGALWALNTDMKYCELLCISTFMTFLKGFSC